MEFGMTGSDNSALTRIPSKNFVVMNFGLLIYARDRFPSDFSAFNGP